MSSQQSTIDGQRLKPVPLNTRINKIKVIHFQRKPHPGFNYSIEGIFNNLRYNLKDRIDFSVAICSYFNSGWFSKIFNIIEASFRQKRNVVSHITGEVYFLNLLMRKNSSLLTIHDCRFVHRKKGMAKRIIQWLYLKAPVKKAAYIVTVSEATKKEVISYTGCNPEKIRVIPVSISAVFKPVAKQFNKDCPVILQVGAAQNKNLLNLIEAVKELPCKLVIIGTPGKYEIEKLSSSGIGYVVKSALSTEELYNEYINCDIVSFVSTFEGFGLPIVEANCVERVVLTSNISSMPEVAGDAACLVNPYDVADIRKGLLRLINDETYREQLIANGRKNQLRFGGNTIANAYYDLYEKILNENDLTKHA